MEGVHNTLWELTGGMDGNQRSVSRDKYDFPDADFFPDDVAWGFSLW